MCGGNDWELKCTGRDHFSCLSRWRRTRSIDTAVEEALITDMYASECEWLPDHSNGEMLLVMVDKLNVVAESNYFIYFKLHNMPAGYAQLNHYKQLNKHHCMRGSNDYRYACRRIANYSNNEV